MNRDMKALVRAQGLALSMLSNILEREGHFPRGELGDALAMLASVSHENDRRSGDIVAVWAAMVRETSSLNAAASAEDAGGSAAPA